MHLKGSGFGFLTLFSFHPSGKQTFATGILESWAKTNSRIWKIYNGYAWYTEYIPVWPEHSPDCSVASSDRFSVPILFLERISWKEFVEPGFFYLSSAPLLPVRVRFRCSWHRTLELYSDYSGARGGLPLAIWLEFTTI
jgi:hypothetical protein